MSDPVTDEEVRKAIQQATQAPDDSETIIKKEKKSDYKPHKIEKDSTGIEWETFDTENGDDRNW